MLRNSLVYPKRFASGELALMSCAFVLSGSMPWMRPRLAQRFPVMAPAKSVGVVMLSFMIGSSRIGFDFKKAALNAIRDAVLSDLSALDVTGNEMLILHADCLADAEWVRDEVRKAHPELGEIRISSLGVVIGAHTGPGLLTVFYLCSKRVPG